MTILIVELTPNQVSIDETLFPEKHKDEFIYEHLRHYCSKFDLLPTIDVRVYTESVVVTRGHVYLTIAKELGYLRIRAIIDKNSASDCVLQLLQNPSIVQLNWPSLMQEGDDDFFSYTWFIFFFSKPLNQEEKIIFEQQVVRFFSQIKLPEWAEISNERIKNFSYKYSARCAEFQAYLSVEDERWCAISRSVLLTFHFNCVPIISFQGRKFQVE